MTLKQFDPSENLMDSQSYKRISISNSYRHTPFYKYLKQLSHDLKNLYETSYNSDFKLRIGHYVIPCHRAILTIRSPWFALKIKEQCKKDSKCLILEEGDFKMIHALLLYIYTGDIGLIEDFKMPAMDLLETAEIYDVTRLKKVLIRMLKFNKESNIVTVPKFSWEVDYSDIGDISVDFPPIDVASDHGIYTWCFSFRSVVQKGEPNAFAEIILERKSIQNSDVNHTVDFHLNILNDKRQTILEEQSFHVFRSDCLKTVISYTAVDLYSNEHFHNLLLKGGKLLMTGSLVLISESKAERCVFKLRGVQKRCRWRELIALSDDMFKMLKSQKLADMGVRDEYAKSQFLHSYIIFTRTSLTREDFQKINDIRKNACIAWLSFVSFIYSGHIRFVDGHMRMLYGLAIEHGWSRLLRMYSDILITCATKENILGIAEDVFVYRDYSLMNSGIYVTLCESGELEKPEFLLKNTLEWRTFILRSLLLDGNNTHIYAYY